MSDLNWVCKHYDELGKAELYQLIQLRVEIFVVEQDCPYQDLDGKDPSAYHLMGKDDQGEIVAYTRLLAPGVSYPNYASIGRVVVSEKVRKFGFGKTLMRRSVDACKELFPIHDIKISAQTYLSRFYTELGFNAIGEEYLEDGIPHVAMIYKI